MIAIFAVLAGQLVQAQELTISQKVIADDIRDQIFLNANEKAWLDANPILRLGMDEGFAPYTFMNRDGRPDGLALDYLYVAADILGLEILPIRHLSWKQVLQAGEAGDLDVIATGIRTEERQQKFLFTEFNIPTPWVVFGRFGQDVPENIESGTVALVRDYAVSKRVVAHHPGAKIIWYDDPVAALQGLSTGEADQYIGVMGVATHLAKRLGLSNVVVTARFDLQPGGQRFMLPKSHEVLQRLLDRVMVKIPDRDRDRLQENWLPSVSTRMAQQRVIGFSEEERAYIASGKVIRYCVDPDWMPYEKIDAEGQHIGIAADYMVLFQETIGMEMQLVPTDTWAESERLARNRKCDILTLLNENVRRLEYLNFTDPYIEAPVVLVARDDVTYLDGMSALTGQTVGIVSGYAYEDFIREKYPDLDMVLFDNVPDIYSAVSKGDIYATLGSLYIVTTQIQESGLSNLKIAGHTEFKHKLRVGVRKDDPVLLSLFQKAVVGRDARQENEILQRWISVKLETGTDYTLLFQVILVASVVGAFLFYRHMVMRQHNLELQAKNESLERLSRIDPLTDLPNRLRLNEALVDEIDRAKRYQRSLSLVIFDIDSFKTINDTYGHPVGDRVLKGMADLLSGHIRQSDILGRWGGEEFVLLCPECRREEAVELARKLLLYMQGHMFPDVGRVTASFGVATLREHEDSKDLLKRADDAMYRAKSRGRNRVESG